MLEGDLQLLAVYCVLHGRCAYVVERVTYHLRVCMSHTVPIACYLKQGVVL